MISVNLSALSMSLAKLKTVRKKIHDTADGRFRQKLYYLMEAGVRVSPQFSGDFASNWFFVIDGNMPVYRPLPGKYQTEVGMRETGSGGYEYREAPHKAGDEEAVKIALQRAAGMLKGVTTKSRVHMVNATALHTDGTHMIGPDGTVKLRGENLIPGNMRIESYIRARAKEPIPLRPL